MSITTPSLQFTDEQTALPVIHLSYECILLERGREADTYICEIACSITYPAPSSHLLIRVTSQNTYRGGTPRVIPFTSHENGATTYLELSEGEQMEIRIIAPDGTYSKALYTTTKSTFLEKYSRQMLSVLQPISSSDAEHL